MAWFAAEGSGGHQGRSSLQPFGRHSATVVKSYSIVWRRLDTPSHDACLVNRRKTGWEIEGTAVFPHEGATTQLRYRLFCDPEWHTRQGSVSGFMGDRMLVVAIERNAIGEWRVNRQLAPNLESCKYLDFSFTPATNFPQIRGLALRKKQTAHLGVAWLDIPLRTLQGLEQRYQRRSELISWYEAPSVGYSGLLKITPEGFIRRYPGLWELDTCELVGKEKKDQRVFGSGSDA
jgi:hypothetical protein